MQHIKLPFVARFELGEDISEQDALLVAVAIQQTDRALGLFFEDGFEDREQGRDAASSGKQVVPASLFGAQYRGEPAFRGHDVEYLARLYFLVEIGRHEAVLHALDRYGQLAFQRAARHRVGSALLFSVYRNAKGQVLPCFIQKGFPQRLRDLKNQRDGFRCFGADFPHAERVKFVLAVHILEMMREDTTG